MKLSVFLNELFSVITWLVHLYKISLVAEVYFSIFQNNLRWIRPTFDPNTHIYLVKFNSHIRTTINRIFCILITTAAARLSVPSD